jgi:uncharacterized protein (DUF302 family)
MTPEGMVVRKSRYGPVETAERLLTAVAARGMTVMAQVDHAAAAASVGLELRPTKVIMFGAPRGGTPVMAAAQTAGIDLPLKVLVWQDAEGATWLGYNDPNWISARHGASAASAAIEAMAGALAAVVLAASEDGGGS